MRNVPSDPGPLILIRDEVMETRGGRTVNDGDWSKLVLESTQR